MIHTLRQDIYDLVKRKDGWFTLELAKTFSDEMSLRLKKQLSEQHHSVGKKRDHLWFGELGAMCPKALWYRYNHPELAEALPPWAEIKFAYGHILEALAITLAKASGHTVCGEQDALTLSGVTGHRDCIIDGAVFDIKSASTFAFQKFKNKSIRYDDPFGYLEQLDGYVVASADDPLVTIKDRGYILAIDKTLGHIEIYEHIIREEHIRERIAGHQRTVEGAVPPACTCETRPSGKSGNVELGPTAGYSAYKHCCFPQLRTFLYADGPVYLTRVVRRPDPKIIEIDKFGKVVYN